MHRSKAAGLGSIPGPLPVGISGQWIPEPGLYAGQPILAMAQGPAQAPGQPSFQADTISVSLLLFHLH